MKRFILMVAFLSVSGLKAQDRNLGINCNFPSSVFIENGGHVIDITKPPYNAVGDGVTDNTAAFVAAYDFIINKLATLCPLSSNCKDPLAKYVFYVPDGTYLVSNTLIYSGPLYTNGTIERFQHMHIIGQSRENTIIKLKDNCAGYSSGTNKPVVSFGQSDFNNTANTNTIRNLTVNTGTGNPGAVGIYMGGANNCSSSNLKIVSGDGTGSIGYDISIGTVVGYHHDIVVEGFDYAVRMNPYHFTAPIIEHITIRNQNVAGVLYVDGTGTIRKLQSENSVPAIQCTAPGNYAVVLDGNFIGGSSSNAAIDLQEGHLFARNITTSGYGSSVKKAGAVVVSGNNVDEYVSDAITKWDANQPDVSMNLPIEDSPEYWSSNLNDWASVDDYPSIQDAFNSGKSIIVFPKQSYSITNAINVPASVRRIVGLYTEITTSSDVFLIADNSTNPIIIEDIRTNGGTAITQACPRTTVINNVITQSNLYQSKTTSGKLFINSSNGLRLSGPIKNVDAWIRFINTESTATQFKVDNSNVVVLSFKTEKLETAFEAVNGSKLEILGGLPNQYAVKGGSPLNPVIEINNSEASVVFAINGSGTGGFENIIRDTQGSTTKTWVWTDFPQRVGRDHCEIVPLYVNHNGTYKTKAIPVSGIALSASSLSLEISESSILKAIISPVNADNKEVLWSSSNSSVAIVNECGLITAVSPGSTRITVKTVDGSFTENCVINVSIP